MNVSPSTRGPCGDDGGRGYLFDGEHERDFTPDRRGYSCLSHDDTRVNPTVLELETLYSASHNHILTLLRHCVLSLRREERLLSFLFSFLSHSISKLSPGFSLKGSPYLRNRWGVYIEPPYVRFIRHELARHLFHPAELMGRVLGYWWPDDQTSDHIVNPAEMAGGVF